MLRGILSLLTLSTMMASVNAKTLGERLAARSKLRGMLGGIRGRSGGGIRAQLGLYRLPAYNEYRPLEAVRVLRTMGRPLDEADRLQTKAARNAAKRRRRQLRARGLHP